MRRVPGMMAAVAVAASVPIALAAQVPQIPATFYGAVTVDGEAPPPGTEVRGLIGGVDCTQPGAAGTIDAGNVGAYVISVMHESQQAGCGAEGREVTFTIAGRPAGQTATWRMGPHEVGLNAGSGSVQPLPSNVPTPTSQATVATTAGPLPTDDIELPQAPPGSATPRPPGPLTNADEDGDDGPPLWGIMVVALMGLGVLGGAAGFALSRREARENPDEPENGGGPG